MKSFKNSPKKMTFLDSLPVTSIETSDIAAKCKFNLSYFDDRQAPSQSFSNWNEEAGICCLDSILNKIKEFTKESLSYWTKQRSGAGSLKILAYYNEFPSRSAFFHPPNIPHDACWARFRLGNKVRLIGFVIPEQMNNNEFIHKGKDYRYDSNTFYLVFFDKNHAFYQTEQA
ncbi:hypothetical protein CMT41_12195 [Colwellia sp. MT41]|uniref:hypothetical protein n=1 Tax=Colwellia sp. MT41 TaxID=58049 RepID=UPI0007179008|nr:hypothetical protein [Colwellia sp. MT41]ALO35394.1 hypothetical protein CMT41_12195 [Colwellia sp. MT41]